MESWCSYELVGTVGLEPEYLSKDGRSRLGIRVVTNTRRKNAAGEWKPEACWIRLYLWGNRADALNGRIHKGAVICAKGDIRQQTYNDKTGAKRTQYVFEPKAFSVVFWGNKQEGEPPSPDEEVEPAPQAQRPSSPRGAVAPPRTPPAAAVASPAQEVVPETHAPSDVVGGTVADVVAELGDDELPF